jgi:hypothetical protein
LRPTRPATCATPRGAFAFASCSDNYAIAGPLVSYATRRTDTAFVRATAVVVVELTGQLGDQLVGGADIGKVDVVALEALHEGLGHPIALGE